PEFDAQKLKRESYEAGYRDGFLAGQQEGYRQGVAAAEQAFKEQQWQQHQHIQQLLNNMAEAIRNEIANFFNRAEEAVTELALEIARKIIEVETQINPEVVRRAVSQAIHELKGGTIIVRLHPKDFSLIGNDLSSLNLHDGVSVRLVPDESIERGGVIAESEQGFIDLQPHTKLALLQSEVF
ncbi:MAG: FliH/SctL family protein, partial [Armatimonadetes bacterium]|nr:FliH/SctL family protein [Armatimonadota bacterium]